MGKQIPRIVGIDLAWCAVVLIPLFQTVIDKVILGNLESSDQDLTCGEGDLELRRGPQGRQGTGDLPQLMQ